MRRSQHVPAQLFVLRERLKLQTMLSLQNAITMTTNWKKDVELEDNNIRQKKTVRFVHQLEFNYTAIFILVRLVQLDAAGKGPLHHLNGGNFKPSAATCKQAQWLSLIVIYYCMFRQWLSPLSAWCVSLWPSLVLIRICYQYNSIQPK